MTIDTYFVVGQFYEKAEIDAEKLRLLVTTGAMPVNPCHLYYRPNVIFAFEEQELGKLLLSRITDYTRGRGIEERIDNKPRLSRR